MSDLDEYRAELDRRNISHTTYKTKDGGYVVTITSNLWGMSKDKYFDSEGNQL